MARILQAMPKPLAVFAANDWSAREIARQAKGCGLHVPGDIAIVGVDDQPQCELSDPPLTSVPLPYEAIGYRAAVQLDRMLQGEDVGPAAIRIPPTEIAVRTSSDSTAIDDREVLAAVQYMRANASRPGVDMADVSRVVAVSRRALERRFRKHFDESPAERFRRIRIDLAKRLLLDTTLTVGQIAVRSGFCNATVFCTTFRKLEATTPLAYRKRYGS
jgi:LacI family transcriptional regulator